jgi:hypothetical protein
MQTVYQGDQLTDTLVFLLPASLGDMDLTSASVFLTYIRSDGSANIEMLEQAQNMYGTYLQFSLSIASKLTKLAGNLTLWLNIYCSESQQQVTQSSTYTMTIATKADTTAYSFDDQLSAMLLLQRQLNELDRTKADGLVYAKSGLQLTSNGEPLQDTVYPNKIVSIDDDEDDVDEDEHLAALHALQEQVDTLEKTKADNIVVSGSGLQLTANGELIGNVTNEHEIVDIGTSSATDNSSSQDVTETEDNDDDEDSPSIVML